MPCRSLFRRRSHDDKMKRNRTTAIASLASTLALYYGRQAPACVHALVSPKPHAATATAVAARGHHTGILSSRRTMVSNHNEEDDLAASNLLDLTASTMPALLALSVSHATTPSTDISKPNSDFDLQLGKVLDTLRNDYPKILYEPPDWSIYDRNIEVVDPSGVTVHGIKTYQSSFRLLHAILQVVYCPHQSGLTFRMCYDTTRHNVRIHWNAQVVPRGIFGGSRQTCFVDGISVYELDGQGNVTQHRFEQLLLNDRPLRPKEGVFVALRQEHGVTVPSYIQTEWRRGGHDVVGFQEWPEPNALHHVLASVGGRPQESPSSLFALEASNNNEKDLDAQYPNLDWDALERKNRSRQKFGLAPLSPDEFLELETQVQQLDHEQRRKMQEQQQTSSSAALKDKKQASFFEKLFGNGLIADTCESNYDCERPQICCDFGFVQRCCSSGALVGNSAPRWAMVPVPVETQDPPPRY